MAIWQFKFQLIPSNFFEIRKNDPGLHQVKFKNMNNIIKSFNAEFKKRKSWNNELMSWGFDNDNEVNIWNYDDGLGEIFINVDVRFNFSVFLDIIIKICENFDLIILHDDNISYIDRNEIIEMINKSSAMQFAMKPREFLQSL